MRKICFLVVCCLCLCGCGKSWHNDFQASDIKIKVIGDQDDKDTYLAYTIKNISKYTCKSMKAIIEFKSGSLIVEETIYPHPSSPLKPNDILTDESRILNKNYEGYIATFKEIDCYIKDTN